MMKLLRVSLFLLLGASALANFSTSTSSNQFVASEKIYCETQETSVVPLEEEVFNYDCSRLDLNWFSLPRLMDHIRASTSLNLAYNSLGAHSPVLRNLTFNLFKQLKRLNLTANGLQSAESHAFFYVDAITDSIDTTFLQFLDPSQLHPLRLTVLDLSLNEFVRIPWDSIRALPDLTILHLNQNPIRTFDLGDWKMPSLSTSSSTDYEMIDDENSINVSKKTSFFINLTEIYLRSAHIERVDPAILIYLKRLRILDLSNNQIRHLSVDLRQPLESLAGFKRLYLDGNPLVCDCQLIWLKEFFQSKSLADPSRLRRTMCLINTRASKKNLVIETKVIYINSTYRTNENYFKLTNINHLSGESRARSINANASSISNLRLVPILEMSDDQFYCDLDLSGQVKDLTLLSERSNYRQEIEITCRVRSFPEAKIKWLFGQRDLDKMFTYENKQFATEDAREFNSTNHMFTVDSKLLISYSGHIGKVNFSCRAFYMTPAGTVPPIAAQPTHLLKSIQFNINSDDDQLEIDPSVGFTGDLDDYAVNSTVLMMREAASENNPYDRPLIYWILLGLCALVVLAAVLFVAICMLRRSKSKRRKEADVSHYGYSTYTASNYSTINKRSAIYLSVPVGSKTGITSGGTASATGDLMSSASSAMIPLKPDVIREHKEHSSIYYRMSASSTPNEYSTATRPATNRSTPIYSTDTTPVYSVEPSRGSKLELLSKTTMATPSTTEESMSSGESSKRDSTRSSKSFEENIDEYLEPECPDLSKPQPKQKSLSKSSPTDEVNS